MEHNKNGMLALIVLFVGLAFLFSVWFIIYGERFKINNNSFKKKYSYEYFLSCHVKHSKLTYMHTITNDSYIIEKVVNYQSIFM